ncbi:MAG: hypothetical protein ABF382_16360 [Akkermansiaceae bacterium]
MICPLTLAGLAIIGAMWAELRNIIIIYVDDLGFGDLSFYNPKATYKTPRLDQMAVEGTRLSNENGSGAMRERLALFKEGSPYRKLAPGKK